MNDIKLPQDIKSWSIDAVAEILPISLNSYKALKKISKTLPIDIDDDADLMVNVWSKLNEDIKLDIINSRYPSYVKK